MQFGHVDADSAVKPHKMLDAPVIGALCFCIKIACRQLALCSVVCYAVAAYALACAGLIGAGALCLV